jgi:molybdenum cofactor cytidylyltransferase
MSGSAGQMAGLVLAAGRSRRMGSAKLTLPWRDGRTVVEAVVAALREGGVTRILVVVGGDRRGVEHALAGTKVEFVENPRFADDEMLGSIQVGLRAMGGAPMAALLTPGDLPAIQSATVRALIDAWDGSGDAICVPVYEGRRGHPVLLPRRAWPEVLALGPGESLRNYLRLRAAELRQVDVPDPGIHSDIDSPEDYRRTR